MQSVVSLLESIIHYLVAMSAFPGISVQKRSSNPSVNYATACYQPSSIAKAFKEAGELPAGHLLLTSTIINPNIPQYQAFLILVSAILREVRQGSLVGTTALDQMKVEC